MAVKDRKFRLTYGDGFTSLFERKSEDQIVPESAKEKLRASDYNGAVQEISTNIYQQVKDAADKKGGLEAVYKQSITQHNKEKEEHEKTRVIEGIINIYYHYHKIRQNNK